MEYPGGTSWIRFLSGGEEYALALDLVAEVTVARRPRLIPFVPLEQGGVINVKGEPMPAINGGAALSNVPTSGHVHTLVLEQGSARVGMLVDLVLRIERGLHRRALVALEPQDGLPASVPFVSWFLIEEKRLGFVDPGGLLSRVGDLLAPMPVAAQQGREDPWPNAF